MGGVWTYALDKDGPCNGDVIVRTAKGSLIAVIYATNPRDDKETLRRARLLCEHAAPRHCTTCGGDTINADTCDRCLVWWMENTPTPSEKGEKL